MIRSIKRVLVSYIVGLLPETSFFYIKNFLYRRLGHVIGENVRICSSARLIGSGKIIIEDNVDIAPRAYIGTGTHVIGDVKNRMAGSGKNLDIIIKKGTWICANVSIMPGVIIEEMNIINTGAVVSKSTNKYQMLGGVPAKFIKDFKKKYLDEQ